MGRYNIVDNALQNMPLLYIFSLFCNYKIKTVFEKGKQLILNYRKYKDLNWKYKDLNKEL